MSDVLLLNFTYEALSVVDLKKAVRLLYAGKAEIVHRLNGEWHSGSITIALPSIVRMLYYIKRGRKRVALTKKNVLLRDRYRCGYCGERGDTVDHIIPRAAGGTSTWENLVAACSRCNGRKRDRTPEQAQMRLRVRPREPAYIPFVVVRRHTARDEWGKFLGLYNVSIDERIA